MAIATPISRLGLLVGPLLFTTLWEWLNRHRSFHRGLIASTSKKRTRNFKSIDISKISPTGPPGRWAPRRFTNSLCFGISFELWGFGEVWGSFPGYVGKIMEYLGSCKEPSSAHWESNCQPSIFKRGTIGTQPIF